jgi:hypothetical protein
VKWRNANSVTQLNLSPKNGFYKKLFATNKDDNFINENANEALIQLEIYVLKIAIVKL